MSETEQRTSVREQLEIMDTGSGRPQLWYAEIGEIDYEDLSTEQWLKPSKLSGGRIALRIDYLNIENHQFVTVESDELRTVLDTGAVDRGPFLREVVADAVEQQREGYVKMRPVLRAATPLAGEYL